METNDYQTSLYTPELLAFAQVGVEFASLMEQGADRSAYIEQLLRNLPRLYSLMLSLPSYFYDPEEDYLEEYVSEQSYERVRQRAEEILGEDDLYLTAATSDMQYSDTPLAMHLSEQLADVYQHVGNLLGILKERNEVALPSAIGRCRLYWQEHWGLALLSALSALHQVYITQIPQDDIFEQDEYNDDENDL
ncbi:MAG: DUF5063 domain-containing protein [Porphyromonas sp.]|nr:DUF5063 domain-containing protein [Porphyromonas sp.]